MSESSIFSNRLTSARKMRGLNQEELARIAGLQPAAISHFETGARKPSFDNLIKLAKALAVTSDYLMGKVDDPEGLGDVNVAFRHAFNGLTTEQRELTMSFMSLIKQQSKRE